VDSRLHFTANEDGKYRLRIQDANQQGGPAYVYRLRIAADAVVGRLDPPHPTHDSRAGIGSGGHGRAGYQLRLTGDTVTLPRGGQTRLHVLAERSGGFTGPITLGITGLPTGVTASNTRIEAGQSATDIVLTTPAFAALGTAHLTINGSASLDGRTITRRAALPVAAGESPIDSVLLSVALKPPFKIVGDYDLRLAPRGSIFRRRYRIQRNGFTGPLEVRLADHQARHLQGVTGPTLILPPGAEEFEYPVRLPPWMEIGRTSRTCILALGVIKDGEIEYTVGYSSEEQNEQIIAVVESGRLGLEIDRPSIASARGGASSLKVRVSRGKGLAGPVKLELIRAEHMRGIHAKPVVIATDQSQATFTLHFAVDKLGPFNMPVVLRATLSDAMGPAIAEAKVEIVPEK
jgi:hypothetical protein